MSQLRMPQIPAMQKGIKCGGGGGVNSLSAKLLKIHLEMEWVDL